MRRSPRLRVPVALLVLLLVAAGCAAGEGDLGTHLPGDLTMPSERDVRAAEPGQLFDHDPVEVEGLERGEAHRVLYRSESHDGHPVAVSGIVFLPPDVSAGAPVVAWGHGTTGLADLCAPSRYAQFSPVPLVQEHLDAGYVVAATDYEGLGTPGPHPYLVGSSAARSVLDSVRAAAELAGGVGPVVAMGHSQGGHAALFAGAEAAEYAPELDVVGVLAVAPAADPAPLLTVARWMPALFTFSLLGLTAWSEVYPELDAADVFTPYVRDRLDLVEHRCSNEPELVVPFRDRVARDLFVASPAELPAWQERFVENRAGERPIPAPVEILHGTGDDLIPMEMSEALRARLCAQGTPTTLHRVAGADHVDVLVRAEADVLGWIADRFAGRRAGGGC